MSDLDPKGVHLRRFPRYPVVMDALVVPRPEGWPVDVETRDISLGGLFVHMQEPLPVGTEIEVKIRFPDREPTSVNGVVVRVVDPLDAALEDAEPGIGIEVQEPPAEFLAVVDECGGTLIEEDPDTTGPLLTPLERARFDHCQLALEEGLFDEAVAVAEMMAAAMPESPDAQAMVHTTHGRRLLAQGSTDEGLAELDKALELNQRCSITVAARRGFNKVTR